MDGGQFITSGDEISSGLEELGGGGQFTKIGGVSWQAARVDPNRTNLMVLNLDKLGGAGTHWVALVVPLRGAALYYDSIGRKPPAGIVKMIRAGNAKRPILYFDTKTQHDSTDSCGFFALRFIARYIEGLRPPELYFGLNYDANDSRRNTALIAANEKKVLGELLQL